jgi:hypothetical protein
MRGARVARKAGFFMTHAAFTRFVPLAAFVCAAAVGLQPKRASGDERAASVYDVSGDGIHVTYATGAADGMPHMTYSGPLGDREFSGSEIRTVAAGDMGTLVSVTLHLTVDTGSTTFTLVIPPVILDGGADGAVPLEAMGITTHHRFSVVPRFNLGQIATFAPATLTGTAR